MYWILLIGIVVILVTPIVSLGIILSDFLMKSINSVVIVSFLISAFVIFMIIIEILLLGKLF